MRIILDGVDGAGKTTLAKILAYKYGLDICHCTQHDGKDYAFYRQTVRKDSVVWDRHSIGELIYPHVFNRQMELSPEDARLIMDYAKEAGTKIFILTCDHEVLKKRLLVRGTEDDRIIENCEYIDSMFKHYAKLFYLPIIDTRELTLSQIFEMVEAQEKPYKFIHA